MECNQVFLVCLLVCCFVVVVVVYIGLSDNLQHK